MSPIKKSTDKYSLMHKYDKEAFDITDDQVLLTQLKMIDQKTKTLHEVNTHYDPKFIYANMHSTHAKKLKILNKKRRKLTDVEQPNPDPLQEQFGGK